MSVNLAEKYAGAYLDSLTAMGFNYRTRHVRVLFKPNISKNEYSFYLNDEVWILISDSLAIPSDAELFISSDYDQLQTTGGSFNCLSDGKNIVLMGEVNIGVFRGADIPKPFYMNFLAITPLVKLGSKAKSEAVKQ